MQHLAGGGEESGHQEGRGAGESHFDEDMKGQEQKARAEGPVRSMGGRENVEGSAEGSSTLCSVEHNANAAPYMHMHNDVPVW